jgi:hypothetical protein
MTAQFIEHHGARVLVVDLSHLASAGDAADVAAEAISVVAREGGGPASILGIVDFTGTRLGSGLMGHVKPMARHNRSYMRLVALVGFKGSVLLALRAMLVVTGRTNHRAFATREQALAWLAPPVS